MESPGDPPCAWRGAELLSREDWELSLEPADAKEVLDAVEKTASLPLEELTPSHFRLPRLGRRLARVQSNLETGSGATRIHALPLAALAAHPLPDAAERAFWGIARHVGTPVSQNADGDRLLHVRDEGHEPGSPKVRGPNTSARLSFHTDRCDVIAFLCMVRARCGGENQIISSMTLREELRRRHPRELEVLEAPFPYLRHTVDGGNDHTFVEQPIFSEHEGHFAASFLRVLIDRAHADPAAPTLTPEQVTALDTLESVADDPELFAQFTLAPGEMLFLNNWVTFHRRNAFEDHDDPAHRRHLMRLWLAVPNSRPLDPSFSGHFGSTEAGSIRGGMPARKTD